MPVNRPIRPSNRPAFWDRDPGLPDPEDLVSVGGRLLDPIKALQVDDSRPRATAYVADTLLLPLSKGTQEFRSLLDGPARRFGWQIIEEERLGKFRSFLDDRSVGVTSVRIGIAKGVAAEAPDAWKLLQAARADGLDMEGVGLEHVLTAGPGHWSSKPGHWSSKPGHWSSKDGDYGSVGVAGRLPVAYTGLRPTRRTDDEWKALSAGERPVVAVLDSGCGEHPWFTYTDDAGNRVKIVDEDVELDALPIGFGNSPIPPDPELVGDYEGPLDGLIDFASGHGTFICGLINQKAPDANILAWRIVHSSGFIREGDVIEAMVAIAELSRRHASSQAGGQRIDILNLSMGFYHESDDDALTQGTLLDCLEILSRSGTSVICAAGNESTARKVYPAAFAPKVNRSGGAPMCAVGALNPNETTIALFSNTGDWVSHYDVGGAVMSTMPAFQGGLEPVARTDSPWGLREDLDPDNFVGGVDPETRAGGFAIWSGTSFAAPVFAGRVARALLSEQKQSGDAPKTQASRLSNAVAVVGHAAP